MLNQSQLDQNKNTFLKLLGAIDIENADTEGLAQFLLESDFFIAPASTHYHCNYEGGLCEHSLNVYNNLVYLANKYAPNQYQPSTLIIAGLFHDISKTNFYEKYVANRKIYNEKGSKHDNQGNYDWFSEESYRVRDAKDRTIGGDHGFNSMMMISRYIPLTYEESIAILNHHCGMGEPKQLTDMSSILNKYPLVTLLHSADFLSTFIDERIVGAESQGDDAG